MSLDMNNHHGYGDGDISDKVVLSFQNNYSNNNTEEHQEKVEEKRFVNPRKLQFMHIPKTGEKSLYVLGYTQEECIICCIELDEEQLSFST